jgi:hypothetical protein
MGYPTYDPKYTWTVGFETPAGHPMPYYEIIDKPGDYVLAFMQSVLAQGWTVTSVRGPGD